MFWGEILIFDILSQIFAASCLIKAALSSFLNASIVFLIVTVPFTAKLFQLVSIFLSNAFHSTLSLDCRAPPGGSELVKVPIISTGSSFKPAT